MRIVPWSSTPTSVKRTPINLEKRLEKSSRSVRRAIAFLNFLDL